ncbi:MAG: phenylalanyl-tRNA synthetase alpha chain [Microgenomates group bacterium Gr01-1014_16]|nr:MAG: phenylalanyl-tRNA synthetase alpha chain [Microgenomates group bacterium Gr01-1014_16]
MREKLLNLKNEALAQIISATDPEELEHLRAHYLGKSGVLNQFAKELPLLPNDLKSETGQLFNEIKSAIADALASNSQASIPKSQNFDSSLPGIRPPLGHLHPVTRAIDEISSIFEKIGFIRVRYPEVDWDWYAFESLNMPKSHPARDDWETFFVDAPEHPKLGKIVLTPHTSNGQVREMERLGQPPIRMINIAKCYRRQSDVSHTPMFHQFEGLVVDEGINITHLKGTINYFVTHFFGLERKSRLRPNHFQFTEPSFEVDVTCDICLGKGCKLCKEGWLELGGAGMVHPNVLRSGKIDPKRYTGFAFGWGVERTYMMKSGLKIPDLRLLYSNDIRFLNQF